MSDLLLEEAKEEARVIASIYEVDPVKAGRYVLTLCKTAYNSGAEDAMERVFPRTTRPQRRTKFREGRADG